MLDMIKISSMLRERQKEIIEYLKGKVSQDIVDDMQNILSFDELPVPLKAIQRGNDIYFLHARYPDNDGEFTLSYIDNSPHIDKEYADLVNDFCRLHLYQESCFKDLSDNRKLNTYGWYLCNIMRDCFDDKTYCGHCLIDDAEAMKDLRDFEPLKGPAPLEFDRKWWDYICATGDYEESFCEWFYADLCVRHNEEVEDFQVCGRYFVSKCEKCKYEVAQIGGKRGCCYYFFDVLNELAEFSQPLKHTETKVVDFNLFPNTQKQEIIYDESSIIALELYEEASSHWNSMMDLS